MEIHPSTQAAPAVPGSPHLPLVVVRGRNGEMGFQMGAQATSQVQHMVEVYRRLFEDHGDELDVAGWSDAKRRAHAYLPYVREAMPQYLEEMHGIADGAQVSFDDILVLNTVEGITLDRLPLGCTSLAARGRMTVDGSVLVGHNEDWYPDDIDHVFLVRAEPESEPTFLALTYGGLLPNIGVNADGLCQCCDTVYPQDVRFGIPRGVIARHVLSARSMAGAVRAALHPGRAAGYNHLLVHADGEVFNLEVSAKDYELLPMEDDAAVHANHYLGPRMTARERDREARVGSHLRYNRARRLLEAERERLTPQGLQTILADHANQPSSICSHEQTDPSPLDRQRTIASLVMDLTHRTLYAAWGNPCQSAYQVYRLPAAEGDEPRATEIRADDHPADVLESSRC
jgi:isopenicillin-N N-acyltransferase-like protein